MGAYDQARKTSVAPVAPFSGRDVVRRRLARVGPAVKHRPLPRYGAGAIATVSAVLGYVVATSTEIAVIRAVASR
jgi:hypothetical protein